MPGAIKELSAREILDSRGEWTIEVSATLEDGRTAVASVPAGKSTGSHEAKTVSARRAVGNIQKIIAPKIHGKDPRNQDVIDRILIKLDGTETKRNLGANAILGVSIACLKAGALLNNVPLWKHVRAIAHPPIPKDPTVLHPKLFINMINGGLHAGNNLDFQEYLVIPEAKTFFESIDIGTKLYRALGTYLSKQKGSLAKNVGDEGGFSPNFKSNIEPFEILSKVARSAGLSRRVSFGLDAAASDIQRRETVAGLSRVYEHLAKKFPLIYLEDPFPEDDFHSFADFHKKLGSKIFIAGDDLTTTNVKRMVRARKEGSVNAVIIKPNQIGTVTETIQAVRLAWEFDWAVVVSHRSGETDDDFIADFAYGVRAYGLKLGAPARGERIAKYNRLLQIEEGK